MESQRPVPLREKVRAQVVGWWCRLRVAVRSPRWLFTMLIVAGFWIVIGWPLYERHIGRGLFHTLFALALLFPRAVRYGGPHDMKIVERDYVARKNRLYSLLKQMQYNVFNAPAVASFQTMALKLIASYARNHRADWSGVEIFVNLLARENDELVVIARDHDHRAVGARYPMTEMLASQSFETGRMAWTGDLEKDFPQAMHDGDYRSVLVLPVLDGDRNVVGAVSIDSKRRHHFDVERYDLERFLLPYVCLLGWTLEGNQPMMQRRLTKS